MNCTFHCFSNFHAISVQAVVLKKENEDTFVFITKKNNALKEIIEKTTSL